MKQFACLFKGYIQNVIYFLTQQKIIVVLSDIFVSFCKQLQLSQKTLFCNDNQEATAYVDGITFQQIFAEVS